ncbi:unnamed protein product [Cuscuta epithymum]|uniref:DUF4378 domain-containing protein n=1 Tax=Cuscuta epithymum TaxID=186058 RepID=A0AAV0CDB1_9ASTE|nr:unnamed protein product [Cuscuta epithymum]
MASLSPLQDQIEDKVVVAKSSGTISNRKSKGTPMKVLIAQEMSKDINNKYNPPSVVAKLMGLDTLPSQQPDSSRQRDCAGGSARVHTDTQSSYCGDSRNGTLNAELCHEFHQYTEQNHCKDVYEVWQHPQKRSLRNKVSESRCVEKDKRIDYVRQKFLEAKFLSIDEKCHQTNQFRDTLEVLSSNTDLFLKFLQEPNPMFPQQISSLPSSPSPSDIKQITVLRPSKMVDNPTFSGKEMNEKQENKANQVSQLKRVDEIRLAHSASTASCSGDGNSTQLTRIVVLKPSTCKSHYLKDVNSSPYLPLAGLHHENVLEFPENKDAPESRELASEITLPRHKNYTGHERDGTLLSSESPDGYTSDESSFNRSENEHAMGNLCNSEVMSPASRHSWDFINRIRSPNSPFSPESPVSREAKKRLSERWAMVASNGVCQEPRPLWRSSSTLGEMLSLSDTNKSGKLEEGRDKEPRQLNSIQFRYPKMMEAGDNSPSKLLRSNFLPVSSTVFSSQLKAEISESEAVKTEPLEETINERSIKSSFKGRFSGLFSRNKKPSKQKVEPAPSVKRDMCSGNFNGNQDQPSPVSVLDTSFEEDGCIILHNFKPNGELPAHSVRSNLIDKSSPIGSIARTLAWDDSWLLDTATSFSLMPSSTQRTEKEREWFYYIQTILSEAGLDQVQYNSFISRWHSPESPLDPSLIDKYIDSHEEESLHEARKKERRSIRKLIFDCVNSVLMDITCQYTYPCNSVMLVDHVWEQMKEWFSWNMVCTSGYDEDGNSLIVENMVANEIVNKGWIHCWKLEWESIGKEIEGKLLEEMVREMIN